MIMKSPSGSTFPYYYKGGEIYAFKYGSYFTDESALLAIMQAEEDFVTRRYQRLRLWVDFYETQWTDALLLEFLRSVKRMQPNIVKMALVGCSTRDRWRLNRLGKRAGVGLSVPVRFFRDPEDAKSWLVREAF